MSIPRPEHPKMQFYRPDWVNLNGPEYCRKQVEAIWKQGG